MRVESVSAGQVGDSSQSYFIGCRKISNSALREPGLRPLGGRVFSGLHNPPQRAFLLRSTRNWSHPRPGGASKLGGRGVIVVRPRGGEPIEASCHPMFSYFATWLQVMLGP
jgi:hypothetical protein